MYEKYCLYIYNVKVDFFSLYIYDLMLKFFFFLIFILKLVGRVYFSFISGIFKRKNVYNDLMEKLVLKENYLFEKSVYMVENFERVVKRVIKKYFNGYKSKVKKIFLDEYKFLFIG